MPKVKYQSISDLVYKEGWELQTSLHDELKANKLAWRHLPDEEKATKSQIHHLLFCEHRSVYTLGKSGSIDHLLLSSKALDNQEIDFFKINRGGDITYHGPGQITGYPIFDMDEFYTDIHKYVRMLEECMIQLLAEYDIEGYREKDFTGVWIMPNEKFPIKRKVCAIGVHLSRWVTMHGFALNVNTDLAYFKNIIPCGIEDQDKTVTSIEQELAKKVDLEEVKTKLKRIFASVFEFEYV